MTTASDQSDVAGQLQAVQARISRACQTFHRPENSIALLAVTKTFPAEVVLTAYEAGQRAFGENYVQEGVEKVDALGRLLSPDADRPQWHFIGPLQSNKTREVAEHFDWVHTIDRLKIAQRLADQRPSWKPPLQVCLQVNVSGEESKSGVAPEALLALAAAVAQLARDSGRVVLRGLMAIPEATDTLELQRQPLAELRRLLERLRAEPGLAGAPLDCLSMGMSGDLEAAIAESEPTGTCWVRVGSAIFGARPKKT